MSSSDSYSWMPGWLRKFLNLDTEMPGYTPGTPGPGPRASASYTPPRVAPASAPSVAAPAAVSSYTPPAVPAISSTPPAASYTPPTGTPSWQRTPEELANASYLNTSGGAGSWRPAGGPPPLAPRVVGSSEENGSGAGTGNPERSSVPTGSVGPEGFVQPIGYGIRTYVRGALPPQGLEQFTREFRATLTDVWNFYSYWTRFQTDELFRMGREAVDVVIENLPSGGTTSSSSGSSVRRIKVNTGGNGNGEKKAAPPPPAAVATPPAETPAKPTASATPPKPADKPGDAKGSTKPNSK